MPITGYSNTISVTTLAPSLLLDLYPSAAAAYSVRKLRTAYTGSAIRVRRSSDNAESDIGFTALGNLDTTSLTSFCGAGNGFVTTWYDQSGNGRNATETTATNQPQIVSSGSVINVNSKPALSFDGTNDKLLNTTLTAASTQSAFFVKKGSNLDGNSNVFGFPAESGSQLGLYYWNSSPFSYGFNTWNGDSWGYDGANTEFLSQTLEMALFVNGNPSTSGVKLFINNTQKTLSQVRGTSMSRNMENGIRIGEGGGSSGNQNYDGWQQELVIWSADYSSTNRTGIQNNINTYYGIY